MSWTIFRAIGPAGALSLLNAVLGFAAIVAVFNGQLWLTAALLPPAAILDWLDGRVARRYPANREWGKQLDSLADIVVFGVAPAVLAWSIIAAGWTTLAGAVVATAFAVLLPVCGILRLARYNISAVEALYIGMPITVNGVSFPVLYILTAGLPQAVRAAIWVIACVVAASLMIADFKIRKR